MLPASLIIELYDLCSQEKSQISHLVFILAVTSSVSQPFEIQKCFAVKEMGGTEAGSNRSAEYDSDDLDRDELVGVENEGETDEERRWTDCNHWPRKRRAEWSKIDQDMFLK